MFWRFSFVLCRFYIFFKSIFVLMWRDIYLLMCVMFWCFSFVPCWTSSLGNQHTSAKFTVKVPWGCSKQDGIWMLPDIMRPSLHHISATEKGRRYWSHQWPTQICTTQGNHKIGTSGWSILGIAGCNWPSTQQMYRDEIILSHCSRMVHTAAAGQHSALACNVTRPRPNRTFVGWNGLYITAVVCEFEVLKKETKCHRSHGA